MANKPFALSTLTVSAPGGMSRVGGANVLAHVDGVDGPVPVAAVWGPNQVTGGGRVVVVMDINWTEPSYMEPTSAAQFAQNVALYLSGRAEPPRPPADPVPSIAGQRSVTKAPASASAAR